MNNFRGIQRIDNTESVVSYQCGISLQSTTAVALEEMVTGSAVVIRAFTRGRVVGNHRGAKQAEKDHPRPWIVFPQRSKPTVELYETVTLLRGGMYALTPDVYEMSQEITVSQTWLTVGSGGKWKATDNAFLRCGEVLSFDWYSSLLTISLR